MANTIISFLSVIIFSSFKVDKEIEKCTKNFKRQNECIILGNGPSINDLFENQYNYLNNKDVFAVNYFCLTDYFIKIKPRFYVLLDADVFEMKFYKEYGDLPAKLLHKLNKIDWDMIVFIPSHFSKSKLIRSLINKKIKVVEINATPIPPTFEFIENSLFKLNLGMPSPQTVINAVIFIAINMKYNSINLFGVEQSWLKDLYVNENNEVNVGLPHFYGGPKKLLRHSSLINLSTFLRTQALCFDSHLRLEKYSKYLELNIINHTPNSYIDAYERKIYKKNITETL